MKHGLSAVIVMLFLLSGFEMANAQRQCGAEILKDQLRAINPDADIVLRQTLKDNVEYAEAYKANLKTTAGDVTIPVVFHIVLNEAQITRLGGEAGIARRIDSQVAVINRDFNKENPDAGKVPAFFQPLHASAGIRFGLARRKPDGTATPGYEIITTTAAGINQVSNSGSGMAFADAKFTNGVANAWNPTQYLNIWVANLQDNGINSSILGITTPPSFMNYNIPGFSNNELGIVLNWGAFGVRTSFGDYYISGITGGRTLTHELGHYFEIWHVWGDDDGKCVGSGGKDDGIADTPPQAEATYSCQVAPYFDACTSTGNGIMFMNFMDYVNDACMQMFTQGQVNVMKSMVGPGKESFSLTQYPQLMAYPTAVSDVAGTAAGINVYPNPATSTVYISGATNLDNISLFDLSGRMVKQVNTSGDQTGQYSVDISSMAKGVYIMHCKGDAGTTIKKLIVQ